MGALHWLVLIPVYFFGALSFYVLFDASIRLARTDIRCERLAGAAVAASLLTLTGLLVTGIVTRDHLGLVPVLVLGLVSFALAGLDAVLVGALPLPSDEGHDRRRPTDPQVF